MQQAINRLDILLALQSALLGEVYPSIRAVVYKYSSETKQFLLRYYLDREPIDDDYESAGNVVAEFISNFKFSDFDIVKEECVYSNDPISMFDIMDGMVYCRKEA